MSFVVVPDEHHFSYHNLPYGIISSLNNLNRRAAIAIGDYVLDLSQVSHLFDGPLMSPIAANVFSRPSLNDFMALTPDHWKEARQTIKKILANSAESPLRDNKDLKIKALLSKNDVVMHLPAQIGDYTDFYSCLNHATNIGAMFRGKGNELLPNYRHIPIAYHGRASSIVVSGTPIARPSGQRCSPSDPNLPVFGPSDKLDFELEMGVFIGGPATLLGGPIRMVDARKHLFGLVLLNDWSARDIQRWEYQPLGPFASKNFATSISPWIVTFEALEQFKVDNPIQDPVPFPYLRHEDKFNFDINLEVEYTPKEGDGKVICNTNFKELYWTVKQMIAHHTVGGCNLNPGDLFGTGTISGTAKGSRGSLIELTSNGAEPCEFQSTKRKFIEDGDEVSLRGYCQADGYRVGFGDCSGVVLPSKLLQARPSIVISQLS